MPGIISSLTGLDVKTCLGVSSTDTTSAGSESRLAASFARGLRLPNAPFPSAPVGALLAVTTVRAPGNPRHGHIVDVDVVDGATVIAPDVAADVHVVVNDLALCNDDTSHALTVQVRHQRPVGNFARQLLKRFAAAIATIRDARAGVTERGVVLSNELSALRNAATTMSSFDPSDGTPIAVDTYPPPLRVLFELLLDRELTWLERSAHLGRLRRERDARLGELLLVNAQIAAAERDEVRLGSYAGWSVRHLHAVAEANDDDHARLARTLSHFVAPLLRTWYPAVRISLATQGEVTRLRNLQPGASYDVITSDLRSFATAVGGAIGPVQLATEPTHQTAERRIAVSFPRPVDRMGPSEQPFGTYDSEAVRVDPARAAAVWDALLNERPVTIALSPYDLYGRATTASGAWANALPHQLTCALQRPIVRRVGIALAGSTVNTSVTPFEVIATVAPTQPILGETGWSTLTFADAYPLDGAGAPLPWRRLAVPWRRAVSTDAIAGNPPHGALVPLFSSLEVEGVSPLAPITFETIARTVAGQDRFAGVHELVVVLELEVRDTGNAQRVAHPVCSP